MTSIVTAKTSGLGEVLLLLENLSFYETLVIWWYRMLIKDQKVHAVKVESHFLLIIFNLEVSDPTFILFYRSLICPSSKKVKLISKYWKIVLLLIYLIDKQPSCEQWQEIWSSFCTKTRMALCLECQPKYTMGMRTFWRSNGRTGIFFFLLNHFSD